MKARRFKSQTVSALIAVAAGALVCSASAMTGQLQQWYVWEKISKCQDTRQDWFTVAQRYPGESESTNAWQQADGPFSTFATAMLAADTAKMAPTAAGRIRLTYSDPKNGPQKADGTYTKTQMTFGDSTAHITYTRK